MHATQSIATKWIYDFSEGSRELRELLGGKGAGIAEMTRVLGPERVPAGFTITTAACVEYMRAGRTAPAGLAEQVDEALARLEERVGKRLGDPEDPLLVSVRSGARESMPGMLDTVLNLGLNDESVAGLAAARTTSASPGIHIGAWCRCSATSYAASPASAWRRRSRASSANGASRSTPSSTPAALRELTGALPDPLRLPQRPA